MILTLDELRLVGLWAAACAERVLPVFEGAAPSDRRPREAIAGARLFGGGGGRTGHLRSLAQAAHAAARQVADPAAAAAARSAGVAAAVAYTHPLATTDQAKHILGTTVYGARARQLRAGGDPAAAEAEIAWAIEAAPPVVREVLRRFPPRGPGRTPLEALYARLDGGLRESDLR